MPCWRCAQSASAAWAPRAPNRCSKTAANASARNQSRHPSQRQRLPDTKNLSKYRVQGGPVEVLWSPTHSQKTRMDRARSVCSWLEVGNFQFLERFQERGARRIKKPGTWPGLLIQQFSRIIAPVSRPQQPRAAPSLRSRPAERSPQSDRRLSRP